MSSSTSLLPIQVDQTLDSAYDLLDYLDADVSGEHVVSHEESQCKEEIQKQEEKEKRKVEMQRDIQVEVEYKGSLQKKIPEIYWSFTNTGEGGSTPRPIYLRFFPEEKTFIA